MSARTACAAAMASSLLAAPTVSAAAAVAAPANSTRTCLVFESPTYLASVQSALTTDWDLVRCSLAEGCPSGTDLSAVAATVGRADEELLPKLLALELVQDTSYFYHNLDAVPAHAAVAENGGTAESWVPVGAEVIAEYVVAAIFEDHYGMRARQTTFTACAFATDAPRTCPPASVLTTHRTLQNQTLGILGYGHIGAFVAEKASGLGMTLVGSDPSADPHAPPPAPLAWLTNDNDRLLRAADVVAVTASGAATGLINKTALALMKPDALVVLVGSGNWVAADLLAALRARPGLRAAVDVWPDAGCWHFPNTTCGAPFGPRTWPGGEVGAALAALPNVLALPGMAMRDDVYWEASAKGTLRDVVRNATAAPWT